MKASKVPYFSKNHQEKHTCKLGEELLENWFLALIITDKRRTTLDEHDGLPKVAYYMAIVNRHNLEDISQEVE